MFKKAQGFVAATANSKEEKEMKTANNPLLVGMYARIDSNKRTVNLLLESKRFINGDNVVSLSANVKGKRVTKSFLFNSKAGDVIREIQTILVGLTRVKESSRANSRLVIKTDNNYIYKTISNIEELASTGFKQDSGRRIVGGPLFAKIHALTLEFKSVTITKY